MINLKKHSLLLVCEHQPIMAFVLLSSVALTGETMFSDIFSVPFSAGLKYGMAAVLGFAGVWGQRQGYKKISESKTATPQQQPEAQ